MPPDFNALGKELYERLEEAVVVPFVERSVGDWKPDERDCHRNCDVWVLNNPGCKAVRGWLIFDFRALLGFVRFQPHSVIEQEDGTLIDITPSRASRRYPFVRHPGSEDEFVQLVLSHWLTAFDCPVA